MTDREIRMIFGKNLKRIRKNLGISQLTLSSMSGLTHTFINDIENCKKWVSPTTIALFCKVLKVEPFHFFLSEENLVNVDKIVFTTYMDDFSAIMKSSVKNFKKQYFSDYSEDDD
jgi:transcriptional regulator with XRE-family HTH domain